MTTKDKDDKPKSKRPPRRSASVVQDALNPERKHRRSVNGDRSKTPQQSLAGRTHGVYAKFFPDEVIKDAVRANLTDELIAMRCGFRNGVITLGRIAKDLELPEDAVTVEQRMELYKLYSSCTNAMDHVLGRIMQIEKTIVEIPYIVESTEAKKVQADKDRALTDKARAEYEILKKGRNAGTQVLFNLGFSGGNQDD